jgi:hypothetical protein
MRAFLRHNGLALANFGLFGLFLIGLSVVGAQEANAELRSHGSPAVGYLEYLSSGQFIEAVFENWESEFLQMASFVLLTAMLFQKGSPESRPLAGTDPVSEDPRRHRADLGAPWPVRAGGVWLWIYERSLTMALALLFVLSFALHAAGGLAAYNEELALHGEQAVGLLTYITGARFWFESLQNWQSEFLAVGALIMLSIFLRQRGSPESKPVHETYAKTGH